MTIEQKIAKSFIANQGFEASIVGVQDLLDRAMKGSSIKDVELQHFWREILVELMKKRH
jgi:hypothetical protein